MRRRTIILLLLATVICILCGYIFTLNREEELTAELPIVLFLPNENVDGFVVKAALTNGTPEDMIFLLVEYRALPGGCELISFVIDGPDHATVDMNDVYRQALNVGTAGEYIRIGSVVNTLLTYYELNSINLTIEGEILSTGHDIYDYPLYFYKDQIAIYQGNRLSTD